MVVVVHKTIVSPISLGQNATVDIPLPNDCLLTELRLWIKLTVSTGTATPSPAQDPYDKFIKRIRIYDKKQSKDWIVINDMRFIKMENLCDYGKLVEDPLPTATNQSNVECRCLRILHFGFLAKTSPWDPSVVLPAQLTDRYDFHIEILTGSQSDLGSNITLNSAELLLEYYGIRLEEDETINDVYPLGLNVPEWIGVESDLLTVTNDITQSYVQIPTDKAIERILGLQIDANNNRSEDYIGFIGIVDQVTGERWFEVYYNQLRVDTAKRALLDPSEIVGFVEIPIGEYQGLPIGDTTNLQLILGYTIKQTGGKFKALFKCIRPI